MEKVILKKSEKSLLMNHLPGILSASRDEVETLIEEFSSEALLVAKMLLEVSDAYKREWSSFTLAKVPLESCSFDEGGGVIFDLNLLGSIRFLMKKSYSDEDVDLFSSQLDARMFLYTRLERAIQVCVSEKGRTLCDEMLTWREDENGVWGDRGLNSDINLLHAISEMEGHLEGIEKFFEYVSRFKDTVPNRELSYEVVARSYRLALEEIIEYFKNGFFRVHLNGIDGDVAGVIDDCRRLREKWAAVDDFQDSLLVRVVANLSANRAILENQFYIVLQNTSSQAMASFLRKINEYGLIEVPDDFVVIGGGGKINSDDLIRQWVLKNFGLNGAMILPLGSPSRFMSAGDVDVVVAWSSYLQDEYVKNRGNKGDLNQSRLQHGFLGNRFIFALVIIAAFFEKIKVPREFLGQKNSMYSVFPAPGKTPRIPGPSAEELLHLAYGQVYFGNSDWYLRYERIPAYSNLAIYKRSVLQNLSWRIVKGHSSQVLLRNFIAIKHFSKSDKSWLVCPS